MASPPQPDAGQNCAGVGDGLRRMFDDVVAAPVPSSLITLCDALESAFERACVRSSAPTATRR